MEDLRLSSLQVHHDDRGHLFEVIHNYDLPADIVCQASGVSGEPITEFPSVRVDTGGTIYIGTGTVVTTKPRFGQVYVVVDPVRGTIRAFHRHKVLWDYFCILSGSAKFIFIKGDLNPAGGEMSPIDFEVITLSAKTPKLITVPPGIWHGWMSLEDNTMLLSIASEVYNKEDPDEERLQHDAFEMFIGDHWRVLPK